MLRYETRWLSPELCRAEPSSLFVYGDNLRRYGKGGQAVIRDEPNAVGVPTKRAPSNAPEAFLVDADLPAIRAAAAPAFARLAAHLRAGGTVVWPAEGIGTGRARLRESAPRIWDMLERARARLASIEPELAAAPAPATASSTRVEDDPLVRAVLIAWPGAQIVAVRDVVSESAESTVYPTEE